MNTNTTIASPDDIDSAFADSAFNGTSHSPEKRGYLYREEYANNVNGLYTELLTVAQSDKQRTVLASEMERYKEGYRRRMVDYLSAHSRVMSPMISGPSNFPVRQMEKRNSTVDKRSNELTEWKAKARKAIVRSILDARTPEEAGDAEFQSLIRSISGSLGVIGEIDCGKSPYTRSAFTTSITGKLKRIAENGNVDLTRRALEWLKAHNKPGGKPALAPRNKVWCLVEVAQARCAANEKVSDEPELIAQNDGVELWSYPGDDRARLIFPGKPDERIRARLKSTGWRWSRFNGAWQRKLTRAALHAGQAFLKEEPS